jgi:NAD(P)H-dependent flavin oxidoreductase YrpB (nitropropane dioxygenase family)
MSNMTMLDTKHVKCTGINMFISTRLTELLKVKRPILLAPMVVVSDGRLAATVSRAGGFGIIGDGYGDETWLTRELPVAALEIHGSIFCHR